MMQSRTRHLLGLDLLRATAIVMVLCAHVPKSNEGLATRILNFGWTGVDLFFVLSGFLIGGQVFQALATHDEGWLKQFYLRRLLRTLPPYYAVVAIYCALAGLLSIPFPTSNYAIFTQNFAPLTTFTASWSLCVEEQFYLLFPCVALLFLRIRNLRTLRYGLLLFLISEAVLRLAIWLHFRPDLLVEPHALTIYMRQLYYPTYTRLDGIALGVGLAAWKCFFPKRWSLLMQHGNFLIAGAGAFMAVAILALWKHYSLACSTLGFTFLNLSFCCLTAAAVSHGSLLAKLGIPGVRYLATISYSVYLTHSLAIEITTLALVRWYVPRHSGIPTVLTVVAILLSSLLLYFCVERPALAFRDRVFRRPSRRLPVVANSGEPGVSIARTNEPLGQMSFKKRRDRELKMRILYLITKADMGGAQVHLLDLVRGFRNQLEPVVAVGEEGYLTAELRKLGISCCIVPSLVHPISPLKDGRAVLEVSRLIRAIQPDVVHAHTSKAGLVGRLAAQATGTPSVFTAHTWCFAEGTSWKWRLAGLPAERLAGWFSSAIINVSEANQTMALRHGISSEKRMLTIWNGIPDSPHRARPDRQDEVRIVMVARFVPQKDQLSLLRALPELREPAKLLFVGDGPTHAFVQAETQRLGLQERVEFLGPRQDVAQLLAKAQIFALATNWEGLPLSILEAMRAGLPAVVSDVGGVSEAVIDKQTGFLTGSGDVIGLRGRLNQLLGDPALRLRMGKAARARYETHFTLDRMLRKTLAVYHMAALGVRAANSLPLMAIQVTKAPADYFDR